MDAGSAENGKEAKVAFPIQYQEQEIFSLTRNESSIQDSFPGGAVAMSCPTLHKIQQSDFLCDSTVGADANPAAVAAWQIQL